MKVLKLSNPWAVFTLKDFQHSKSGRKILGNHPWMNWDVFRSGKDFASFSLSFKGTHLSSYSRSLKLAS